MDKIKKNKIIFSMITSIIVSIAVFFFFSFLPVTIAKNEIKDVTPETESGFRADVAKTPKNKIISDLKLMHEQIRKSRIRILEVLHQADKALEMRFPGVEFNNAAAFTGKMNIYIAALKDFYSSFKNAPSDIKTSGFGPGILIPDEPFDVLKEDIRDEAKCRLAQKKLMITIELLNALNKSILQLKEISEAAPDGSMLGRFKKSAAKNIEPRCAIVELKFYVTPETVLKPRDERTNAGLDGSEFYTTLPFSFEVILEPEAFSLFLRNLTTPEGLDVKISNFPELDDALIEQFKEKLTKDKVKEELREKKIEDYRLELELARKKAEFEQVKKMFTVEPASLELEAASTAVRKRYGMRFDFLSASVKNTEIQQTITKHLFRDADARAAYMDTFPDEIGLDKRNPLPPQGKELKDHEGRYKKTNLVRETLSRILVPTNEKGPAYFIATISGSAVDFIIEPFIEQILVEEGLVMEGLELTPKKK